MNSRDKTSIFDGISQIMDDIDPARVVPLVDRVLVRDMGEPEKEGSIYLPATAAEVGSGKKGLMRLCEVVAVGPGDKWIEGQVVASGLVKRRVVKTESGRLPMEVKVGDRVLCDRRKDLEVFIRGERFSLLNAEQSILAVVEG